MDRISSASARCSSGSGCGSEIQQVSESAAHILKKLHFAAVNIAGSCENIFVKLRLLAPFLLTFAVTASAQTPDSQAAAKAGAVVFQSNCARCHGANLEGSKKAPPIAEIRNKKHWTDDRITYRILNGAGKMPAFRETLSDEQIRDLIAYLRAENRPSAPPQNSPQN